MESRVRGVLVAATVVLLAASSARDANAQGALDREEWATFGVEFGRFAPRTTFQDATFGESSFRAASAIGFSAAAWPHRRVGLRFKVARSQTDGTNESSEYAPIAVQDPTQWSFTGEITGRHGLEMGTLSVLPYIALGAGMRHYTWQAARHNESKFFTWTAAGGADIRPSALGPFGISVEVRGYRSVFNVFGINGGNWRPGTAARPVDDDVGTDIGFYGGVVDSVWSHDFMFTIGLSYSY
jgi:hypothetical protein